MNASIGSIIKNSRSRKGLTRTQLAKKIKISEGYLGHLERNAPVALSPRLTKEFKKLGVRLPQSMVEKHNIKSSKYYRNYFKKVAKRNKK